MGWAEVFVFGFNQGVVWKGYLGENVLNFRNVLVGEINESGTPPGLSFGSAEPSHLCVGIHAAAICIHRSTELAQPPSQMPKSRRDIIKLYYLW